MIRPRLILRGGRGRHVMQALSIYLEALTAWNVYLMEQALARGRAFPPLYGGRFRYQREDYTGIFPEDWRDAAEVVSRRGGDCEDLAAYRAAELRAQGHPGARPMFRAVRRTRGGRGRLFHIVVTPGDGGDLEDPSRLLGMTGAG
jgi:hypothetical protein